VEEEVPQLRPPIPTGIETVAGCAYPVIDTISAMIPNTMLGILKWLFIFFITTDFLCSLGWVKFFDFYGNNIIFFVIFWPVEILSISTKYCPAFKSFTGILMLLKSAIS